MKLAFIRRQFSPVGGAELYLQRLLTGLRTSGHELHLYAESWNESSVGDVTLHPVRAQGNRAARPKNFSESVGRALTNERFDCVFSLERTARQDIYRAGDGVHRVWLERRSEFAPWWRKILVRRAGFHRTMLELERATFDPANTRYVIANSEMVRNEIIKNFAYPASRIHLVRNGVEMDRFQGGLRNETRHHFGIEPDDFLLLFVGSGWERKGLKFLLAAMKSLENRGIKLLVIGKGRVPVKTPSNVIFGGTLARPEDAYAAADLFTFLPIYEPSANVCIEALAAGLPVLTSGLNGASEVIRPEIDGTVLPDPSDSSRIVEAIIRWAQNPRRIHPATDLSLERNIAETLSVIELACREREPNR